MGWGSDSLLGRSGDRIPVGSRFPVPAPDRPNGVHPPPLQWITDLFPRE